MTASTPSFPQAQVLCVDDEPLIREVLSTHLRRLGCNVATCPDGLSALRVVSENLRQYDLIITDNQMPHMDGLTLVQRLREVGFKGGIVFFSSTLRPEARDKVATLGVHAIVEKGRPVSELIGAISRALSS